ncbi:AI-2E family transporter [candidate division KSB1 bacterium]|nr:AI-2E family transporter [candidate division KSB1 bacterium]
MKNATVQPPVLLGLVVLALLVAFLWATHIILSPILIGSVLLFILFGQRELPIAKQLAISVVIIFAIWIFLKAQTVFFPLFFSFLLAYLFDPVVDQLVKWRFPRTLGVIIVLLLTFGLLILMGSLLVPNLVSEIQDLIGRSQNLPDKIVHFLDENLPKVASFFKADTTKLKDSLTNQIPGGLEQLLSNLLKGVLSVGSFLGQILNVILIPIITFYLLKDFDKIKFWLLELIPKMHRGASYFYLWRFNRILGGYLRGQVIVCTIVGILTGLGLTILGVPFAILLGVLTGLLNFIPFIGLYISLGLAFLVCLLTADPVIAMLKVAGVFVVVQGLEAYIISPKIVGERVGLHPVAVIFSVLVFSKFFGFWGLLIGVPTAAVIKFFIDEWKRREKWKSERQVIDVSEN